MSVSLLSLCMVCALGATTYGAPFQAPGTQRMAARLDKMIRGLDPMSLPFMSAEQAALIQRALASTSNRVDQINLQVQLGLSLLNAGDSQRALEVFGELDRVLPDQFPAFYAKMGPILQLREAIAYLRIGEQQNCLVNHSADSCIVPIAGGGVHKLQAGSRGAIGVLSNLLSSDANNLSARWLLNIGYMTLGEWPAKVPPAWLIPPEVFKSEHDIGRFPDVAGFVGLDYTNHAGGIVVEDFDGDGFLDVMTTSMGVRDQMRFFHNNGDGTFGERTEAAGLTGEIGGLNLVHADYNNDGFPDVLVLRGGWMGDAGAFPCSLLRNNGDGTFSDVTEEAGLLRFHPTQTAVWFDFNNDGWLDLFIGNESIAGGATHPCELFRNNGDGTFTECARESGVAAVGLIKGAVSADFNNDGRPDLFITRRGGGNILFRNEGPQDPKLGAKSPWRFTDVTASAGVREPEQSFTTWFFDYDNDGWPDIFVAGYKVTGVGDITADYLGQPHGAERPRLYHNNHDGTFKDVTREVGLYRLLYSMGGNFGDLDNDGWLDFYVGTGDPDLGMLMPKRMFRNAEGQHFQDVTTSGGFGQLQKGHGVAFADIDNDGDQDVFEELGGAYPGDSYHNVLYENPGHGNHWLKLRLIGHESNRSAIGARICVTVQTASEPRQIYRIVGTGGSFGGSPLRQEIGLGKATAISQVEVFWPASGKRDMFKSLTLDSAYVIREGEANISPWPLQSFKIATKPMGHDHGMHMH